MPYIGNTIRAADDYRLIDDISSGFNGSETSFALQVAGSAPVPFPKSPQQVLISVNGVIQEPDPTGSSGFNLVGTNIVFSSAPTNGHAFFGIIYATADYLNAGGNFPAGSLGAPSITFIGDENTGLFRKSGGSVGFVSDATEIANFDSNGITISSGNIIIPDSIIHNGDTNTKIRFPAADTVTIETSGSERLRVDSSGRVGIGTASPAHKLHVADATTPELIVEDTTNNIKAVVGADNSVARIGSDTNHPVTFRTNDTERVRIDTDGNVGIGMTASGLRLDVQSATNDIARFSGINSGGITIRNDTSNEVQIHSGPSDALIFGSNGENERMRIRSDGFVNIGTTGLHAKFTVQATSQAIGSEGTLKLQADAAGADVGAGITFGNTNARRAAIIGKQHSTDAIAGYLAFGTRGSSGDIAERMRISSAGNVGIGTTSPESLCAIKASSGSADLFSISDIAVPTSGDEYGVAMIKSNAAAYMLSITGYNSNSKGVRIYNNGGSTGRTSFEIAHASGIKLHVDGNGNVGIQNSSPSSYHNSANNLVVGSASGDEGITIVSGTGSAGVINFADGTSGSESYMGRILYRHGDNAMSFHTNTGNEQMRITAGGAVGIGITTPQRTLHQHVPDSGANYHQFTNTGTGTAGGDGAVIGIDNGERAILWNQENQGIRFGTNNTERMVIGETGRVGINVLDANGGFVQMKPLHNFDNGASGIQSSGTQATMRIRTSSNSSMSLYIGGLDDSIDSARPYLQVGNLSGGGPSTFYDLYLCPFGGIVRTLQIIPKDDNSHDLGSSSNRWDDVFATNGTINTSDRNEKNTIVDSDLGLSFINKLKPVSYKFNGKTRTHYGLIAQDIETVLSDINKSTTDFAGFIKGEVSDVLYTEDEPLPAGKNVGDVKTPGTTNYGLRYAEFIAPLIKAVQELSAKVAALEAG